MDRSRAKHQAPMHVIEQRQSLRSPRIAVAATVGKDRRREPRSQGPRPVYVQAAAPCSEQFEEVRIMRDNSSCGFYFSTDKSSYSEGMELHVIPGISCLNLEYVGEVVRIESLPDGHYGVAVRLVRVRNLMRAS